jgi:NADH:ubiquinone oxidoreductase subunit 6 (subunit J)
MGLRKRKPVSYWLALLSGVFAWAGFFFLFDEEPRKLTAIVHVLIAIYLLLLSISLKR